MDPVNNDGLNRRLDRSAPTAATFPAIAGFRIIREIGRGGMGVVFEAEEEVLNRRVALKVLPVNVLHRQKQVERFEREAKAAARLHHTNIVPVFGVGHQDGHHYYVMQYIEGQAWTPSVTSCGVIERSRQSRIIQPRPGRSLTHAGQSPSIASRLELRPGTPWPMRPGRW